MTVSFACQITQYVWIGLPSDGLLIGQSSDRLHWYAIFPYIGGNWRFAISQCMIYTVCVQIGSVPYLNARPLIDWLARHPSPGMELRYATPSVLVEQLLAGELDIAMASTFPTLVHPELHLLPGLGVTTTGAALSVRLLSRVPAAAITSVALDASSRSTNALAQIILADGYGITPVYRLCAPDKVQMLAVADAAVLIGDIGIAAQADGLLDIDLGQAWYELTGLPFFFAGWVARDAEALAQAAPMLFEALAHGLERLEAIADEEATRLHLPRDLCRRYLARVMRYHTGDAQIAGLEEFRRRATRLGLLARPGIKIPG